MKKPGISMEIPGFGKRQISTILTDYSGTLSRAGKLTPGVKKRLTGLAKAVDIHVLTADTFGTAQSEIEGCPVEFHPLQGENHHDIKKREFLKQQRLDPKHVAVLGNGNNDRLLLKAVKDAGGLAIAVDNGEGCAIDAITNAHLFVVGVLNALDLLLKRTGCKATLRF